MTNYAETIKLDFPDPKLKPLSLASLVDLDKGSLLTNCLDFDVEHLDKFNLVESNLRDLGFISPIKVLKGNGSRYFLRSSSKVLVDPGTSVGRRGPLTTKHFEEGTEKSYVYGALRVVDACVRVSL